LVAIYGFCFLFRFIWRFVGQSLLYVELHSRFLLRLQAQQLWRLLNITEELGISRKA